MHIGCIGVNGLCKKRKKETAKLTLAKFGIMCFLQFRSGKNNHSQAANPAKHLPRKIKQATN